MIFDCKSREVVNLCLSVEAVTKFSLFRILQAYSFQENMGNTWHMQEAISGGHQQKEHRGGKHLRFWHSESSWTALLEETCAA